jgi:hypothetical protein
MNINMIDETSSPAPMTSVKFRRVCGRAAAARARRAGCVLPATASAPQCRWPLNPIIAAGPGLVFFKRRARLAGCLFGWRALLVACAGMPASSQSGRTCRPLP